MSFVGVSRYEFHELKPRGGLLPTAAAAAAQSGDGTYSAASNSSTSNIAVRRSLLHQPTDSEGR